MTQNERKELEKLLKILLQDIYSMDWQANKDCDEAANTVWEMKYLLKKLY